MFFQGLLELAGGEAAVLGIVGRELSHLDRGHVLKRFRCIKLPQRTLARLSDACDSCKTSLLMVPQWNTTGGDGGRTKRYGEQCLC